MQLTLNFNPPTYTIRHAINDYIAERGVNWRPATVTTHKSRLNLFAKWLDSCAIAAPERITYRHIADHLSGFKAKSWYTRKASFEALRGFFGYLKVTGKVGHDVFLDGQVKGLLKLPRQPRVVKTVVGDDVLLALLRACESANDIHSIRDGAMLRLMMTCGLRRGEVARIKLSDVDFSTNPSTILILGKGGDCRTVHPPTNTVASLVNWLQVRPKTDCCNLFVEVRQPHGSIDGGTVNHIVRQRANKAGLSEVEICSRKLRRRYATQFINNGGSVVSLAETMGHSSIATTQVYLASHIPIVAHQSHELAPDI